MSEANYWSELSVEIAGATTSGMEAFFKEFAKIQNDFVDGQVAHSRVVEAGAKAQTLALTMERARETVLASRAAIGEKAKLGLRQPKHPAHTHTNR